MSRKQPRAGLLRAALLFNATFSTACAIGALWIADVPGLPLGDAAPAALRALAAGLFAFALFVGWQASKVGQPNPPLFWVGLTILMDEGWVVGSGVLLLFVYDEWQPLHVGVVAVVAGVVQVVATAQWVGLARLIRERDPSLGTRSRYELSATVDASAPALWRVLAELDAISSYAADLRSSVVEGEGVGAVRTCRNVAGQRWSEEVTEWAPEERAIVLRFRSEEPDFPMPMDPMIGGWQVEPLPGERAHVRLWWSFTTKPAWAAPLMVALMDKGVKPGMLAAIHAMAAEARSVEPAVPLADLAAESGHTA
jgi:hypothetical protein